MRIIKYLVLLGIVVAVAAAGAGVLLLEHFNRDLPDYQQLADYQPPTVTRVHAGDGRLLGEYATERRIFVPVAAMPPKVIKAFLAAEDRDFYSHPGVNVLSLARAALTNIMNYGSNRRPVGASTITQQVAKNFLLTNELSYQRKIKEALLAFKLEQTLSKDRILELYLNEIYLGQGAYGVAAAALTYFNKSLDELTTSEVAFLGALPKAPNNYNPTRYPEAAKARRDLVIEGMVAVGFITPAEGHAAQSEPLVTRARDETEIVNAPYFAEEVRRELVGRYGEKGLYQGGLSVRTSLDPRLQLLADKSLRNGLVEYDRRHGYRGPVARLEGIDPKDAAGWRQKLGAMPLPAGIGVTGWSVAVVLGTDAEAAEIGLRDGSLGRIAMEELRWARQPRDDQKVGPPPRNPAEVLHAGDVVLVQLVPAAKAPVVAVSSPAKVQLTSYGLRQIPQVSGALVALDPHTGRVLAMTGGFSFEMSQFNRVTQAKRQPGSSIKPIIYLAALDNGMTPSTLILDAPFVADQGPGLPKWKPHNYTERFYGPTPLRVGIEQSRNIMTARLAQTVGMDKVAPYVERLGIMDKMPQHLSMALGAGETTPLKMTTAYAMLVNGGKRIQPSVIDRVQDRNGHTVFRHDARDCSECGDAGWVDDDGVPPLVDDREQVLDPRTAYQMVSILQGVVDRGTGNIVATIGKPLAGKTGTSNDSKDAWFIGFSPDLAVGVFIGFDTPATLGDHETGASVSAPVFKEFMAEALKNVAAIDFRIPAGIRLVRVNPLTGLLAQPGEKWIYEAFKPGTEPTPNDQIIDGGSDDGTQEALISPDSPSPGGAGLGGTTGTGFLPAVPPAFGGVGTSMSPGPAASPYVPPATRGAPTSGTGGLY